MGFLSVRVKKQTMRVIMLLPMLGIDESNSERYFKIDSNGSSNNKLKQNRRNNK